MITPDDLTDIERDWYNERAAIYEFDAGMTRREAERKALQDIEKKRRLV